MNSPKRKELLAESVLVIAGVFVFRGMWLLLDQLEIMHNPLVLWFTMLLGLVATVWALGYLINLKDKN